MGQYIYLISDINDFDLPVGCFDTTTEASLFLNRRPEYLFGVFKNNNIYVDKNYKVTKIYL